MLVGALSLAACGGERPEDLRWRDTWELLGITDDGEVVDFSFTVGNTGLLRGQGHGRLTWLSKRQGILSFRRDYAPEQVEVAAGGLSARLAGDRVGQAASGEDWSAALGHLEVAAVAHLVPEGDPAPRVQREDGRGLWGLEAVIPGARMSGWMEASQRGGMLQGHGVALHRFGDRLPVGPRQAVFVLGRDVSIGLDIQDGLTLLWAELEGRLLDPSGVRLVMEPGEPVLLDFRPELDLVVQVRRRRPRSSEALYDGLSTVEQGLLSLAGVPTHRVIQGGLAEVRYGDRRLVARGLMLEVGGDPGKQDNAPEEAEDQDGAGDGAGAAPSPSASPAEASGSQPPRK